MFQKYLFTDINLQYLVNESHQVEQVLNKFQNKTNTRLYLFINEKKNKSITGNPKLFSFSILKS